MATHTKDAPTLEDRIRKLETAIEGTAKPANFLTNLLQGVTLVSIVAFAFWLGALSNKVEQSAVKLDSLYSATIGSKDSLSSRLSVVETRLDSIETRLSSIDKRLESIDSKLSK